MSGWERFCVLPIAVPLLAAAIVAARGKKTPRWFADALSLSVCAAVAVACGALAWATRTATVVHWVGGWGLRPGGVALGIALAIDPLGAGFGALSATLCLAAIAFSLTYFDTVGATFHALMLIFLAALVGFGLTGDLFNLFVFFELMSAAAVALCGYKIEETPALQGAINFGVTNTIGAFMVLTGLALLYGRTGALNMAQISRALSGSHDGLVITGFTLLACGYLIKSATAPFHFWLGDAHAVAPTPVSVMFSGVMVMAGTLALVRLEGTVFQGAFVEGERGLRWILAGAGALTATVGALMSFPQRHLKRLLAFSTVSHGGVVLMGVATMRERGVAGAALYALSHGCAKGALFLCAGVLLHRFGSVDEIALHGRGRAADARATGVAWVLGALALAGTPGFGTFAGGHAMESSAEGLGLGWVSLPATLAAVLTTAAVLRAGARVFLGAGSTVEAVPGVGGKTSEGRETRSGSARVPWTMVLPAGVLLAASIATGTWGAAREGVLAHAGRGFSAAGEEGGGVLAAALRAVGCVLVAGLIAGATLRPERVPRVVAVVARGVAREVLLPMRRAHSGHVGDYVAWLTLGVAAFGGLCAMALR